MREILFRGKSPRFDSWAFGNVVKEGMGFYISKDGFPIAVDGKTIGQYTGLTDKNGVNIFEGDMLKVTDEYHPDKNKICTVKFGEYKHIEASMDYPNGDYGLLNFKRIGIGYFVMTLCIGLVIITLRSSEISTTTRNCYRRMRIMEFESLLSQLKHLKKIGFPVIFLTQASNSKSTELFNAKGHIVTKKPNANGTNVYAFDVEKLLKRTIFLKELSES